MFKGTMTSSNYTSGNIAFSQYRNTCKYLSQQDGTILAKKSGVVDVKANLIITTTSAGAITLNLLGNGVAIPGASYTVNATNNETYTLSINDAVVIASDSNSDYATISITLSSPCTIVSGDIIAEYR